MCALVMALWVLCIFIGSVHLSPTQVWSALTGSTDAEESWQVIVVLSRIPSATTALVAGAALSVAGLQLQTTFDNPLAGPSILGVSTGASLGVAIVLLGFGGIAGAFGTTLISIVGAVGGALIVLMLLLAFSRIVRSTAMLLIVGIIIGYLASSIISLLNFFSTQEGVHSFVIWGLGSFSGMTLERAILFSATALVLIALSFLMVKPLDALRLGDGYAANLGVNVRHVRSYLILLSGLLTALVTAFCGPITFVGLIVPHIARLIARTASHSVLLGITALCGSALTLLCQLVSVLPSGGIIPINAITPVIGAPVILYVIVNRNKIYYMR